MRVFRKGMVGLATAVIGCIGACGVLFVGSSAASAASNSDKAGFHVTWSLNCDDRSAACATDPNIGLGGFWGAATLNANGTDTGQETGCGHSLIPGAAPGGAAHSSFTDTWVEFPFPGPGAPGPGPVDPNGNYLSLGNSSGLFPVPATFGHYSFSFEGAKGNITIAP